MPQGPPLSRRYEDELRTAEEYAGGGTKSPEQALADVQHRLEREWAADRGPGR